MRLIIVLALFYSAPAVTEQEWQGWQPWMVGGVCQTQIDLEELTRPDGSCGISEIKFKKHGRKS